MEFKSRVYHFGEKKYDEVVNFEFDVESGDVQAVAATCTCTNVKYLPEEKKVTGQLELKKVANSDFSGRIERTITVYVDDGEPFQHVDDYRYVWNNKKGKVVLSITGNITNSQ